MIRRNHIETIPKIDRNGLKTRPKVAYDEPTHPSRQTHKLEMEAAMDENNRLVSNKKYHQYKDWRDGQTQKIQPSQWREEVKYRQPMQQLRQSNDGMRQSNDGKKLEERKLKRDYEYEMEDTLKLDYNSISLAKPAQNKYDMLPYEKPQYNNTSEQPRQTLPPRVSLQPQNTGIVHRANISHNNYPTYSSNPTHSISVSHNNHNNSTHNASIDTVTARSPSRKRAAFQSTQKYVIEPREQHSNSSSFKPLFEQTQPYLERKYVPERPSISKYPQKTAGKISNLDYVPSHPSKQPIDLPRPREFSLRQPTPRGKQQVGEKLKLISDFNDQINERIKNIIVCFEGLKNKL